MEHKDVLKSLVLGTAGYTNLSVREIYWGYIISSDKGQSGRTLRDQFDRYGLSGLWALVAIIWLINFAHSSRVDAVLKLAATVGLLAAGFLILSKTRSGAGVELRVNTDRRQLHFVVRKANGDNWVQSTASFDDIREAVIQRSRSGGDRLSFVLRMKRSDEVIPVAVGSETDLMAIHDRLMRDLRPLDGRLATSRFHSNARSEASSGVFPQIGPDQVVVG